METEKRFLMSPKRNMGRRKDAKIPGKIPGKRFQEEIPGTPIIERFRFSRSLWRSEASSIRPW
jgi:hypothetical protein